MFDFIAVHGDEYLVCSMGDELPDVVDASEFVSISMGSFGGAAFGGSAAL